jgi:hypothetical protein
MEHALTTGKPTRREVGLALLLYAAITAASLVLGAQRPATPATQFLSCAVIAAGTLAMAWLLRKRTPYPRGAFLVAAGVLAAAALASPWIAGGPEAWSAGGRSLLWMHPWYFMVLAWTPPSRRAGVCATDSPWAGRLVRYCAY